ncbi:MAG TPA: DNA alkylation repair protein [Planctomycetota bacterium]|nr:DNA alkylation repair protein [Planctomycetota bacterium]
MPAAEKRSKKIIAVAPAKRKGARRMSEIPASVLADLNAGRTETITLVEWLAIDIRQLMKAILPEVGLDERAREILARTETLANESITRRCKGAGAMLQVIIHDHPRRDEIFEALAANRADMVRSWANYALSADTTVPLKKRVLLTRRFAADSHMAVRECAWDGLRPYIAADLKAGLALLEPWTRDRDPNIRRCAIECTRPRGVWCQHIEALKDQPELALPLLENVRADASNYVQRSVANWLNDASKHQPKWVQSVCKRWLKESDCKETRWIVNRALRTIRK